jgi:uncharacterized protein (TIGR01244 family)
LNTARISRPAPQWKPLRWPPAWTYRHLPVDGGWQSPEQIAAFAELLHTLPQPMLAFCRSGARSTRLFQQAIAL